MYARSTDGGRPEPMAKLSKAAARVRLHNIGTIET